MGSYFPSAKHSRVILDASMAVVSGNFTLMSAGYFLSPEARNVLLKLQKNLFYHSPACCFSCEPSSGTRGMSGMNLEKTLLPIMGLETKQE